MKDFEEMKNRAMRSLMDGVGAAPRVDYMKPSQERRFFRSYADFSAAGDLTIRRDEIDPWSIYKPPEPVTMSLSELTAAAREEAAAAERARIAEKLAALQPMEQPYTRRDWALEQKGEKAMYEKIIKAISGPDKKGEA